MTKEQLNELLKFAEIWDAAAIRTGIDDNRAILMRAAVRRITELERALETKMASDNIEKEYKQAMGRD